MHDIPHRVSPYDRDDEFDIDLDVYSFRIIESRRVLNEDYRLPCVLFCERNGGGKRSLLFHYIRYKCGTEKKRERKKKREKELCRVAARFVFTSGRRANGKKGIPTGMQMIRVFRCMMTMNE
jgi:hypothetical protein